MRPQQVLSRLERLIRTEQIVTLAKEKCKGASGYPSASLAGRADEVRSHYARRQQF